MMKYIVPNMIGKLQLMINATPKIKGIQIRSDFHTNISYEYLGAMGIN
jgi:hypothetical protein